MSVRHLDALFRPRSVAVVGASRDPRGLGHVVLRNLLRGGFEGPVMPVHPEAEAVAGVLCHRDVASLPVAADLAVICTPAATVPALVDALGRHGTRAVVVLAAGASRAVTPDGRPVPEAMLEAAGAHGLRLLGPNSLGLLAPGAGLNASFAHAAARPGDLAFLSQSGAVCTAVLDWALGRSVGFSHFVSLGDGLDVDAADVIDYLGADPEVSAILLYLESVRCARKFLSAARAAARTKPVLVVKGGRVAEGARAAATHSGALAGSDAVYDAAFRRAGMLRVERIQDLFDAAETLARAHRRARGERLAILTNGGGLGVLATDALLIGGGSLAKLAPATLEAIDRVAPPTWSRANPADIIGDAPPERYAGALRALREDPGVDTVLVIHAPTALAASDDVARTVVETLAAAPERHPVLASWLGGRQAEPGRRLLREAGVPTFDTHDEAVSAFLDLVAYRRNQEALTETPPSLPQGFEPRTEAAREVIRKTLAAGREQLSEPEAKAVLAAYQVPVVETRVVADGAEAARAAREIGLPVALKILSPDVVHKSDVGGVCLDLATPEAVEAAASAMAERLAEHDPKARLEGFTVQAMARRPGARELFVGAASDAVFGPVVLFGEGGTAVEVIGDRAVGLPPLNPPLARQLVEQTRVARRLAGFRNVPPADLAAVTRTLVQISQLLIDLPEVVELDVNPLLADARGVLALDARVVLTGSPDPARLAIRPYPRHLEEEVTLRSGRRVWLRPIRPEDEPAHAAFFGRLEPEDVRFRFFNLVRRMPHSQLARYTQIDYDREMAFIATAPNDADEPETLGVARAVFLGDGREAEFAIVVRSDLKGQGLGRALLEKLIAYSRSRGTHTVVGQVLPDNRAMLDLTRSLGFESRLLSDDGVVEVRLHLDRAEHRRAAP